VWALVQSRGDDGHRSLVTPEKVLSEYKEDLILIWFYKSRMRFDFYSLAKLSLLKLGYKFDSNSNIYMSS